MDPNEIIERCASVADQLAEVLDGVNTYEAQDSRLIAELIRTLRVPQMTQVELIAQDAVLHGTGYMQAGKRIDPSEVYAPMTTLTQSDLDDMRERVRSNVSPLARSEIKTLFDHIAQVTAELTCRESLIKDHLGKIMHLENRVDAEAFRAETAEARIAELEAHPSAQSSDNNVERVARIIREEIVRQYRDDERGKCPAGRTFYEEQIAPELIAVEAIKAMRASHPSAQFVAGMREAAEKMIAAWDRMYALINPRSSFPLVFADMTEEIEFNEGLKLRAILAEAALKGEGK